MIWKGSVCSAVGQAVASNTGYTGFKSSHHQFYFLKDEKLKRGHYTQLFFQIECFQRVLIEQRELLRF